MFIGNAASFVIAAALVSTVSRSGLWYLAVWVHTVISDTGRVPSDRSEQLRQRPKLK